MELAPIIRKYAAQVEDFSPDHSWGFPELADFAAEEVQAARDRSELRAAIRSLLDAGLDDAELNQLWSQTNAGVKFKQDGTREFLAEWLYALEHETHRYTL